MTAFTTHHTGTNCLTDATAPGGHGTGAAVPDAPRLIDPGATIDEYLDRADWRINANANQDFSLGGMMLNTSGKVVANYWLDHVFTPEAGAAHREGAIHIHDLDMLAGYCAGWSLRALLEEGFGGVAGAVSSAPPKHLTSALGQMVNFLGTLQNEWAGAQSFSSFDTYLAPFVRIDGLTYDQVEQAIQEFVFNLNVPSRWGTQTPFTNLTFDWVCPPELRDQVPFIGDEPVDFAYGDLQAEMDLLNRAFIEVMGRDDASGRAFTFPIPTYNITADFDWDHPNTRRLFDMTAKYGLPYFQNFINSDLDPGQIRSMCCRLQLDLRELLARGNGLFGSAELTGSIGVVTVNCARLGFPCRRHARPPRRAGRTGAGRRRSRGAARPRRKAHRRRPVPVHEAVAAGAGQPLLHPGRQRRQRDDPQFHGRRRRHHHRSRARDGGGPAGPHPHAARGVPGVHRPHVQPGGMPAEGATRTASPREDRRRYPGILQAGTDAEPFYTNSSQLPVGYTDDPFRALAEQEDLQSKYTGGTVLHLYMGEALDSGEACATLVRRSLENFHLPYVTVTPTFSVCAAHGYHSGELEACPTCGGEVEVWTRVMGYFRPVSSFNIGKKGEHHERLPFAQGHVA